jgi:hypothetical protein
LGVLDEVGEGKPNEQKQVAMTGRVNDSCNQDNPQEIASHTQSIIDTTRVPPRILLEIDAVLML